MSILGLNSGYTVKYTLRLQEFPWASPSGTPSDAGVYLTEYLSSRPNTDTVANGLNPNHMQVEVTRGLTSLSKCHTIYKRVILDQRLYAKEMRETLIKYNLPEIFAKAKLACYHLLAYIDPIKFLFSRL